MRRHTRPGGMVAVLADAPAITRVRADHPDLDLAAVNTATNHVLAGPAATVDRLGAVLDAAGLRWQRLAVDRAFHSALLDPILAELRRVLDAVPLRPLEIPLVTGVDGTVLPAGHLVDAEHLLRHARQPVRFDLVLAAIGAAGNGPVLEVGPNAVLTGLVRATWPTRTAVASQRHDARPDTLARAVAQLHVSGGTIDWSVLLAGCAGGRVPLPAYPFQRRTHWSPPVGQSPAPAPPADASAVDGPAVEAIAAQVRSLAEIQVRLMSQLAEVLARRDGTGTNLTRG